MGAGAMSVSTGVIESASNTINESASTVSASESLRVVKSLMPSLSGENAAGVAVNDPICAPEGAAMHTHRSAVSNPLMHFRRKWYNLDVDGVSKQGVCPKQGSTGVPALTSRAGSPYYSVSPR